MDFITNHNAGLGTTALKPRHGRLEWFPVPILNSIITSLQRMVQGGHGFDGRTPVSAEVEAAQTLLCQTADELTRSNKELEDLAVVRHDLLEPLSLLRSNAKQLRDRYQGQLDPAGKQQLAFVVAGVERLERLVEDLQAYSRLGFQPRAVLPIHLDSALNGALRALGGELEAAGAELSREPLPMVPADALQLTQVFQNLLGNAIKFRSARPLRIKVGVLRMDSQRVFFVKDNGMGMDPLQCHRVFELFQQLHGGTGTGIGLSICRKIIERHGGRIWVDALPGKGATFSFTLPDPAGRQRP